MAVLNEGDPLQAPTKVGFDPEGNVTDDPSGDIPPPAPSTIAQALARLRACCPPQQQCCPPDSPMAPWVELEWFCLPEESFITLGVLPNYVVMLPADPMRVAFLVSNPTANNVFVSTSPAPSATGRGLVLNSTEPILIITQAQFGSLATVAWYCSGGGMGGSITVFEICLKAWPSATPPSTVPPTMIPVSALPVVTPTPQQIVPQDFFGTVAPIPGVASGKNPISLTTVSAGTGLPVQTPTPQ